METLLALITAYGLLFVFITVFLDQGGIPVPAYPPIIVTTALAHDAGQPVWPILAVATLAALAADLAWFAGGRRLGARLLRLMCKLSLSPDSCVAQTRDFYGRWGAPSLVVAKFIPGFAAVATTLAGETRTRLSRFIFFDGLGALLWAGVAVALGVVFHSAVRELLANLEALGRIGLPVLGCALLAFVGYKWLQRHRFLRQIRMNRISVEELHALMRSPQPPLVVDVRNAAQRQEGGWIPGSLPTTSEFAGTPAGTAVVVYCDCPNEASAALVARTLTARGLSNVRPLAGGLSAWVASGGALQRH